jgi:hypothetical protein
MGRDEDQRNGATGGDQLLLEFQTTHMRQPHIDNKAGRVRQMTGLQKVFRRGAHRSPEPHRAQETVEGLADGLIIIDYCDQGGRGHMRLSYVLCVHRKNFPPMKA